MFYVTDQLLAAGKNGISVLKITTKLIKQPTDQPSYQPVGNSDTGRSGPWLIKQPTDQPSYQPVGGQWHGQVGSLAN